MNNTTKLSDNAAVSLRRTVGIISLILSVLTIALILIGIVPIFHQSSNPITIVYNAFEVLSITSKPFLYCLLKIVFSLIYVILLILSLKDLFAIIRSSKFWFKEKNDTKMGRTSITNCVFIHNDIFVRLIALFVISYSFDSYTLSLGTTIILVVMTLCNFAINFLRMFLAKRNVMESIFSPMSTCLMLLVTMLFMFNICDVEIGMLIRQMFDAGRMLIYMGGTVGSEYIIHTILTGVVVPILYLCVLGKLTHSFVTSVSYGRKYSGFVSSCRGLMISNIIFACVIVTVQMISERSTDPTTFFALILGYLEFILFSIAVFLLSKNQGSDLPDAPTYDDLMEAQNAQPAGEFEYNGFTFDNETANYTQYSTPQPTANYQQYTTPVEPQYDNNYQQYSAPQPQYDNNYQQYSAPQQQYNNNYQQYSAPQPQYDNNYQQYSAPQPQYDNNYQQYSAPQQQYNNNYQQYSAPQQQYDNNYQQYNAPQGQYDNNYQQYSAPQPQYDNNYQQYSAPQPQYNNNYQQYNAPQGQYNNNQQYNQNNNQGGANYNQNYNSNYNPGYDPNNSNYR